MSTVQSFLRSQNGRAFFELQPSKIASLRPSIEDNGTQVRMPTHLSSTQDRTATEEAVGVYCESLKSDAGSFCAQFASEVRNTDFTEVKG